MFFHAVIHPFFRRTIGLHFQVDRRILIIHGVNGMKDAKLALVHFVMILGALLLTRAVIRG